MGSGDGPPQASGRYSAARRGENRIPAFLTESRVWLLPRPRGTGTRQEVEGHSCAFLPSPEALTSLGQNPGPSGKLSALVAGGHRAKVTFPPPPISETQPQSKLKVRRKSHRLHLGLSVSLFFFFFFKILLSYLTLRICYFYITRKKAHKKMGV